MTARDVMEVWTPENIAKTRRELEADRARAAMAEWGRFKHSVECAISQWGEENVRGLIDQIMEDRKDAADEERLRQAYEAARRVI